MPIARQHSCQAQRQTAAAKNSLFKAAHYSSDWETCLSAVIEVCWSCEVVCVLYKALTVYLWCSLKHQCPEMTLYVFFCFFLPVKHSGICNSFSWGQIRSTVDSSFRKKKNPWWTSRDIKRTNAFILYEHTITARVWQLACVHSRGQYRTLFGLCTKSQPADLHQVEKKNKKTLFFCVPHKVEAVMLLYILCDGWSRARISKCFNVTDPKIEKY